jgi:hypothetical protein
MSSEFGGAPHEEADQPEDDGDHKDKPEDMRSEPQSAKYRKYQ